MAEIKLIYTPDAEKFRPPFEFLGNYANNPEADRLRKSYGELRKTVGDLPDKVGVVTHNPFLKKYYRQQLTELRESDLAKRFTHHLPLEIIENIIFNLDQDLSDPTASESAYRTITFLLSYFPPDATNDMGIMHPLIFAGIAPTGSHVWKHIHETFRSIEASGNNSELLQETIKTVEEVEKVYTDTSKIREFKDRFAESLRRHKVSKDFPLFYVSPNCIPELCEIDLVDKREVPECASKIMEYIEAGCKASGEDDKIEKFRADIEGRLATNSFGRMKRLYSLDEFLASLPNPQTIITDTYLLESLPKLKELDFEAIEFQEK